MPDAVADVLGQASERLLVLTGWIGEAPTDGADVAHLLMHPLGHGVADKMRVLAGLLGLGPATELAALTEVPAEVASVALVTDARDTWAQLHIGEAMVAERPVPPDWQAAARSRGWVILTVGQDPLETVRDLDRYLTRSRRLHIGRLTLQEPSTDG